LQIKNLNIIKPDVIFEVKKIVYKICRYELSLSRKFLATISRLKLLNLLSMSNHEIYKSPLARGKATGERGYRGEGILTGH